jgi:two-component system response regulator FlrC
MESRSFTLLVVDDDPGFRQLLATILAGEGYQVRTAAKVSEARREILDSPFGMVISDLKLPDGDGLDVQKWMNEHRPNTPFVLITGFGSVPTAVEAMKRGALDYLEKPLRSPDELRRLARRAETLSRAEPERVEPAAPTATPGMCPRAVARDPRMLHIYGLLERVAPTPATVLLLGESGVGKEVIARCIHAHSKRAGGAFIGVNCAALSPTLVESELFGHERGAFTGAEARREGVFERARGGTLFLDEIGDLDAALQAKLLRVLQERKFERLGGSETLSTEVRVIAATNRDLRASVEAREFRADLYYRLNTFPIEIPPLRERPADVDALAELFVERAGEELEKPGLRLSEDARFALRAWHWPGNVRELENVIARAAILVDDVIRPEDLPLGQGGPATAADRPRGPATVRQMERSLIEAALDRHNGNRTHAARELGISLRTLQYRLKEYGINR